MEHPTQELYNVELDQPNLEYNRMAQTHPQSSLPVEIELYIYM